MVEGRACKPHAETGKAAELKQRDMPSPASSRLFLYVALRSAAESKLSISFPRTDTRSSLLVTAYVDGLCCSTQMTTEFAGKTVSFSPPLASQYISCYTSFGRSRHGLHTCFSTLAHLAGRFSSQVRTVFGSANYLFDSCESVALMPFT